MVRYYFPAKCFFMLGNRKKVISGKYGLCSTSSKPQSHTAPIPNTDVCAGALSWWNRTPFIGFPGRFEISLVLLFKVLNYLSSVGLSGRKGWIFIDQHMLQPKSVFVDALQILPDAHKTTCPMTQSRVTWILWANIYHSLTIMSNFRLSMHKVISKFYRHNPYNFIVIILMALLFQCLASIHQV